MHKLLYIGLVLESVDINSKQDKKKAKSILAIEFKDQNSYSQTSSLL